MTAEELLAELRTLGSEKTRKTYARHGIRGDVLGVSYADLEKLTKRIRTDHALSLALWDSGVHDARILATKVADAKRMDAGLLDGWVETAANQIEADAAAAVAVGTPHAKDLAKRWLASDALWVQRAGWSLVGRLARDGADLPDKFFDPYLAAIERAIHTSPNRIREGMNSALIAIGCRNDALEAKALAAAKRIGKVHIDHGDTDCKTPDAAEYIKKTRARQASKAARKKA